MRYGERLTTIQYRNIYYFITYDVNELKYFKFANIGTENIQSLLELQAVILIRAFDLLIRNGYYNEYRVNSIITDRPRGRINISKSLSNGHILTNKLVCDITELHIDNYVNRIVKATIRLLLSIDSKKSDRLQSSTRARLYKLLSILKDVNDIKVQKSELVNKIDIPEWYRPVFSICKVIWFNWMAMDTSGDNRLLELSDSNRLPYIWEKYVRGNITKRHSEYNVSKPTLYFDNGEYIIPDIVIINTEIKEILIIDCKWYESEKAITDNLSKLHEYCSVIQNTNNIGVGYKVTGINLYACTGKSYIKKPRVYEMDNVACADAFMSIDCRIDELDKQIDWFIEQGFKLNKDYKETEYSIDKGYE